MQRDNTSNCGFVFFLTVLGLHCFAWLFLVAVCGLSVEVGSRCGAQALGTRASVVVACGL